MKRRHVQGMRDSSRFILLSKYLRLEDLNAFIETLIAIYASIPYHLETKRDEAYRKAKFRTARAESIWS